MKYNATKKERDKWSVQIGHLFCHCSMLNFHGSQFVLQNMGNLLEAYVYVTGRKMRSNCFTLLRRRNCHQNCWAAKKWCEPIGSQKRSMSLSVRVQNQFSTVNRKALVEFSSENSLLLVFQKALAARCCLGDPRRCTLSIKLEFSVCKYMRYGILIEKKSTLSHVHESPSPVVPCFSYASSPKPLLKEKRPDEAPWC